MTNQQILEKAIQKAIEGGFNPGPGLARANIETGGQDTFTPQQLFTQRMMQDLFFRHALIFNHDFAKALWPKRGEAKMHYSYPIAWRLFKDDELHATTALLTEWQYHLQQMVIADNPIKYLGENI